MKKTAFDNEKYLKTQSEHILERISQFDNKLYLEFGGKLFDDAHASRVLPGFKPDSKLQMLLKLKDMAEIVIVVNANDIESNKLRGDLEISYDSEVLRLIDSFSHVGLYVGSVVITQFSQQHSAIKFKEYLESKEIPTFLSYTIEGYPGNIPHIVSDEGFGKNEYIKTSRPLVVVTAPGPGSGKLSTCMSQMYMDYKNGIRSGYAKFETFPIWNLPLKHPVNVAYEAATADLNDVNMIDPFHLEAYGETTVNYNRDVEAFPVLQAMFMKIMGECPYKSPTDMGVNMAGNCIIDDEQAGLASQDEVIRRYYNALCDYKLGKVDHSVISKIELLMTQLNVSKDERRVVLAAEKKAESSKESAFSIELEDGRIVTGRRSELLGAPSACLLNALKVLANINDDIPLISPHIIEPVNKLKTETLHGRNPRLHLDEVLLALAISATTNPVSHMALQQISKLDQCEAHSTVMLDAVDKNVLRKLGLNFTATPKFRSKKLFLSY
ncbi:DUF1846 domain-containing protein [Peptoniphilaceae bacterium SGI.131]